MGKIIGGYQKLWGIKATVKVPHKELRKGGVAWVHNLNYGNNNKNIQVYGTNRRGRKIISWINTNHLENCRVGFAVWKLDLWVKKFDKEEATNLAAELQDISLRKPEGG